jgi:hypothetical protein
MAKARKWSRTPKAGRIHGRHVEGTMARAIQREVWSGNQVAGFHGKNGYVALVKGRRYSFVYEDDGGGSVRAWADHHSAQWEYDAIKDMLYDEAQNQ